MEVYNSKDMNDVTIVLETNAEKHAMWHLLNISDSLAVSKLTNDSFNGDVFEDVSFSMFEAYNSVADEYEKMLNPITTLTMEFMQFENGKAVYKCPVCTVSSISPYYGDINPDCSLCGGLGVVYVKSASSKFSVKEGE